MVMGSVRKRHVCPMRQRKRLLVGNVEFAVALVVSRSVPVFSYSLNVIDARK